MIGQKCAHGCGRTLVGRPDWSHMTKEQRVGHGQHECGGVCRACYEKCRRQGVRIPSTRKYAIDDLLEDLEDLRGQGCESRRQLADRLGMKLKTLETALLRAKKKGSNQAATILQEVRRDQH